MFVFYVSIYNEDTTVQVIPSNKLMYSVFMSMYESANSEDDDSKVSRGNDDKDNSVNGRNEVENDNKIIGNDNKVKNKKLTKIHQGVFWQFIENQSYNKVYNRDISNTTLKSDIKDTINYIDEIMDVFTRIDYEKALSAIHNYIIDEKHLETMTTSIKNQECLDTMKILESLPSAEEVLKIKKQIEDEKQQKLKEEDEEIKRNKEQKNKEDESEKK